MSIFGNIGILKKAPDKTKTLLSHREETGHSTGMTQDSSVFVDVSKLEVRERRAIYHYLQRIVVKNLQLDIDHLFHRFLHGRPLFFYMPIILFCTADVLVASGTFKAIC